MDWSNLDFGYHKTNVNARCYFRNGKWGNIELTDSEQISLHMASTCLHYGQEAFEGLKAYRGADGRVRLFRVKENAKRMISSAAYIKMQAPPEELFVEMVKTVVKANQEFVPPYESGATLYVRPLLIGISPQVGVKPSHDYLLVMFVTPVGPYFKEGFKPIQVIIDRNHDRAAPHGTGHVKVGGNYAAGMISMDACHDLGYGSVLYLDAKEKKYIDECGPANFYGIRGNRYITPKSDSILPSITNMSIKALAEDMGMQVEERKVLADELATFDEAGMTGTAAVISPIDIIYDPVTDIRYNYGTKGQAGVWSTKLYQRLRAIQYGAEPDKFGWIDFV